MNTATLKLYELINPSDGYTFYAGNPEVAAAAAWIISGNFGAVCLDGDETDYGIGLFGIPKSFTEKVGDIEKFLADHSAELAEALESFVVGTNSRRERKQYDETVAALRPEMVEKWKADWSDAKRSSMNDIGKVASQRAAQLRKLSEK